MIQLVVESEKAEFHLEMGGKRKTMTGRTYTARFKMQQVKTVDLDIDESIEGPDATVTDEVVAGPPDSVVSEKTTLLPRSQNSTDSETEDINGVMLGSEGISVDVMDNVVCQPSDGNCLEESSVNRLHRYSSHVKSLNSLQEASTSSARPQDNIVSETDVKCMHPEASETRLFPESVNDSRPAIRKSACPKTKRISSGSTENDLCSCDCVVTNEIGRLCTCKKSVQSSKESMRELNAGNTDDIISEIARKCNKRELKLQCKQQEKIQEFHKIWDEKREQLDKDNGLEAAFIQYVFSEVSVRTEKLKRLNETYLCKIENLKLMKDVELKNLEAEHVVAMNEEKQKAKRWLSLQTTKNDVEATS